MTLYIFDMVSFQHGMTGGMEYIHRPENVMVRIGLPGIRPESLQSHVFGDHLVTTGHIRHPSKDGWLPFQRVIVLPHGRLSGHGCRLIFGLFPF